MSSRRILFSDHAQRQLQERGLPRSAVVEILGKPDQIIEGHSGRKVAQRMVRQGRMEWLFRVVYVEEGNKIVVVTVYRTSKVSKYFEKKS